MREATRASRSPTRAETLAALPRLLLAGILGVAAALLVSCGTSGKGLIPTGNAGPLQSDFEAVARGAQNANGSCTATAAAITKTEQDFGALPATVDAGLRSRLREGITNLRKHALEVCAQPLPQATVTTAPRTSTSTQTTPTTPTATQTTPTQTVPTTSTPTTTGPGGTPAPGEEAPAEGTGKDGGKGNSGGAEPGAGGEGSGKGK
jgi:hypothetical protein